MQTQTVDSDITLFRRAAIVLAAFATIVIGYDVYIYLNTGIKENMSFLPVPILAIAALMWYGKRHFEKISREERRRSLDNTDRSSYLHTDHLPEGRFKDGRFD